MSEKIKKVKQVCKCTNCGNEAEMTVTCSLEEEDGQGLEQKQPAVAASEAEEAHRRVRGTGTCSHCGNEAEMWVDL